MTSETKRYEVEVTETVTNYVFVEARTKSEAEIKAVHHVYDGNRGHNQDSYTETNSTLLEDMFQEGGEYHDGLQGVVQ